MTHQGEFVAVFACHVRSVRILERAFSDHLLILILPVRVCSGSGMRFTQSGGYVGFTPLPEALGPARLRRLLRQLVSRG